MQLLWADSSNPVAKRQMHTPPDFVCPSITTTSKTQTLYDPHHFFYWDHCLKQIYIYLLLEPPLNPVQSQGHPLFSGILSTPPPQGWVDSVSS